jgi:hypothetical protein
LCDVSFARCSICVLLHLRAVLETRCSIYARLHFSAASFTRCSIHALFNLRADSFARWFIFFWSDACAVSLMHVLLRISSCDGPLIRLRRNAICFAPVRDGPLMLALIHVSLALVRISRR